MSQPAHKRVRTAPLLIVEDSDSDFETLIWAMGRNGPLPAVVRCRDGDEALDALRAEGVYAGAPMPRPCLILLDLNLSSFDGRNVLEQVKRDPNLRMIPVVVWTGSRNEADVSLSYARGANSYVVKPTNGQEYLEAAALMEQYWLDIVTLPGDLYIEAGEGESRRDSPSEPSEESGEGNPTAE